MKVACIQLEMRPNESKAARVDRVLTLLSRITDVDLVLLPELWPTGFFAFDRYEEEAEDLSGPFVTSFAELARMKQIVIHGGSFIERKNGSLFNTSFVLSPKGDLLQIYRKFHLFGIESSEAQLLTAGSLVSTVDLPGLCSAGLATCYDVRFPELFRVLADREADVILVPSAWPTKRDRHWRKLAEVRALENQAFLVGSNCAGEHAGASYAGQSLIVGPDGELLALAGDSEEVLYAELDLKRVQQLREQFPVLRDRRIQVTDPSFASGSVDEVIVR